MDEVAMPRFIDDQPQIFFWELDEAALFIAIFGMGIAVGSVIVACIIGYFATKQLTRFKSNALPGTLLHIAFWAGLTGLSKTYSDSFNRDFYA